MTKQHYENLTKIVKVILLGNYCFTESLKLLQTVREYIYFYENQTPFILFLVSLWKYLDYTITNTPKKYL